MMALSPFLYHQIKYHCVYAILQTEIERSREDIKFPNKCVCEWRSYISPPGTSGNFMGQV